MIQAIGIRRLFHMSFSSAIFLDGNTKNWLEHYWKTWFFWEFEFFFSQSSQVGWDTNERRFWHVCPCPAFVQGVLSVFFYFFLLIFSYFFSIKIKWLGQILTSSTSSSTKKTIWIITLLRSRLSSSELLGWYLYHSGWVWSRGAVLELTVLDLTHLHCLVDIFYHLLDWLSQ